MRKIVLAVILASAVGQSAYGQTTPDQRPSEVQLNAICSAKTVRIFVNTGTDSEDTSDGDAGRGEGSARRFMDRAVKITEARGLTFSREADLLIKMDKIGSETKWVFLGSAPRRGRSIVTHSALKGRITLERRGVPRFVLTFRGEENGPWTLVGPGMTSDGKFASQGYRETGVQGDAFESGYGKVVDSLFGFCPGN